MIETLTITTLVILYLVFFRPGKTPPLDNQLVIDRPGLYRITLAARLNLAQPFIEAVAKRIDVSGDATRSSAAQFFEVSDRDVKLHGNDSYLLAVAYRCGMLHFQAAAPESADRGRDRQTIRAFSDKALSSFPDNGTHSVALDESIAAAVRSVAEERGVTVNPLP